MLTDLGKLGSTVKVLLKDEAKNLKLFYKERDD